MKGDKVMKFINNKLYINYSELSPEQKSIYRMRIKYYKVRSEKIYVIYNAWQHYNRIKEDDSIFEKIGI